MEELFVAASTNIVFSYTEASMKNILLSKRVLLKFVYFRNYQDFSWFCVLVGNLTCQSFEVGLYKLILHLLESDFDKSFFESWTFLIFKITFSYESTFDTQFFC